MVLTKAVDRIQFELLFSRAMELRLYANDRDPSPGDQLEAYEEPSGYGYSKHVVEPAAWSVDYPAARCGPFRWEFLGTLGSVHGWTLSCGGVLVAAKRFEDAPVVVLNPGDAIEVESIAIRRKASPNG